MEESSILKSTQEYSSKSKDMFLKLLGWGLQSLGRGLGSDLILI